MDTETYVYAIHEREDDIIKVGVAQNVEHRRRQLQIGNGRKLVTLHQAKCPSKEFAREVEKRVHIVLADFRLTGEWFCYPVGHIRTVINGAIPYVRDRRSGARYGVANG